MTLTEEDMASCSIAFQKPKNAEEERKLIENGAPKSTSAVKTFLELPKVGKQNLVCSQLASLECNDSHSYSQ